MTCKVPSYKNGIIEEHFKQPIRVTYTRYKLRSSTNDDAMQYQVAHTENIIPVKTNGKPRPGCLKRWLYHREKLDNIDDGMIPMSENIYIENFSDNTFDTYITSIKRMKKRERKRFFQRRSVKPLG
jgi:hypothetical protein